jgi:hypothetical protein
MLRFKEQLRSSRHFSGQDSREFVADRSALKDNSAAAQFTTIVSLLNSSRADFVREVGANRKAVYLNFPFWVHCSCATFGMGEKERDRVIRAIRQAWESDHIKLPLPAIP